METFLVLNGDFTLGPQGGYTTIHGKDRLMQDLTMTFQEPYGDDRFHPRFGSVLPTFIGQTIDNETRFYVQNEVLRIVTNYVAVQNDLIQQDVNSGAVTRFTTEDVINSIDNVIAMALLDKVYVTVSLQLLSNELITINTIISND